MPTFTSGIRLRCWVFGNGGRNTAAEYGIGRRAQNRNSNLATQTRDPTRDAGHGTRDTGHFVFVRFPIRLQKTIFGNC